jgi:hypothetical protein
MALETFSVFENRTAGKYDGTNSAEFAVHIPDFTVVAETPAALTFTSGGVEYTVALDGYIAWYDHVVTEVFQNEDDYRDRYTSIAATNLNHIHYIKLETGVGYAVTGE